MDLTRFSQKEEKEAKKDKKEIILNNLDICVIKIGDMLEFEIKNKDSLKKYQNFLFLSPTDAIIANTNQQAQEFFELSLSKGVEGLMFKNLQATYKPGLRSGAMAKLKESKEDLDVVILAAEYGKGKRAGFFSSFLVGVKNDDFIDENERFLEIGKVSSGVKELSEEGASISKLTSLLLPLKISEDNGLVRFEPKIVIQVKYQEIQKSTTYSSGYALRFPRIIMLREDKTIDDINSVEEISRFIS